MREKRDTDHLITESVNPASMEIDCCSTEGILRLISAEDAKVARAVENEIPNIGKAVDKIVDTLRSGGRLFFVGAGTSGRLGVMEAAECPPTFGTEPSQVRGIIAGGKRALYRSVEGAEDSPEGAVYELEKERFSKGDFLVGIAASSGTPYVEGAISYASGMGAGTALITCNPVPKEIADVTVTLLVGPEVIVGSTRLKSATATKMALNMLTTAAMIRMGKTYGNLMVEVKPASEKLRSRQERIVMSLLGVNRSAAQKLLQRARRDVKAAVLMDKLNVSFADAKKRLAREGGFLRRALGEEGGGKDGRGNDGA